MEKKPFWPFRRNLNATRIVALSYFVLILTGTLLLMLPCVSRNGVSVGPLMALFTATSATCVTGLTLVDTLGQWNLAGQSVILCLIQLGGLGFMTAYTLILLALQRRIGLSQRMIMASTLNLNNLEGVVRVAKHALFGTVFMEGVGATLLSCRFIPEYGFWPGVWRGIFHSISAFCNAGFDLMGSQGDLGSLMRFEQEPMVLLVHMFLIVAGGLGFFVWEDIWKNRSLKKLSLYSQMVLVFTGILIFSGFLYFYFAEYGNPMTLGTMAWGDKLVNALFQSVTLRTAGFSTFSQGGLHDSSLVISILFMLIGGSSGSTAGGIKTVTAGLLVLSVWAGIHGREDVTIRGRTIHHRRVMNALTLAMAMGFLFFVCSMTISLIEGTKFIPAAFEVASAMGTVGVTTGLTPNLTIISKLLLVGLMYLGRVGILSFSIAFLTRRRSATKVKYPNVSVMIG